MWGKGAVYYSLEVLLEGVAQTVATGTWSCLLTSQWIRNLRDRDLRKRAWLLVPKSAPSDHFSQLCPTSQKFHGLLKQEFQMQTHGEYCILQSQGGNNTRQKSYPLLLALLQSYFFITIASTYMVLTMWVAATYCSSWGASHSTLCFTRSSLSAQQLCITANVPVFYEEPKNTEMELSHL